MKKYQEIFNDIKEKITEHIYPAEHVLPTEKELQAQYQVSRDTIRKALAMLTERGLIQKVQGKGSLVLKQELLDFPVSGLTSYQELAQSLRMENQTKVVSLELVTVTSSLAQLTGFEPYQQVWKIVRTRSIDGKVSVLDTDYLSKEFVPHLTKEIAQVSIYAYLEGELGLDIAYAQKEITVEPTNREERELMNSKDDYLVQIRSRVFLGNTQQFQYTESKHKIDKFRFVDFARRKNAL
ncbi:trehalose operon repressor [Streptococcus sp. zg-86]|uniref:Trehalose operon repressor n=1 Tax=Streptococcus zhangguiae TaxID=2664091 RepID=A0A6I4RMW4_9STRE|nr:MULTISPECIES: trehalose operon repressor [unclassified Streptococcus]MTB63567.1 trehalose operon repressor [Streptococcus sp. zg-86]MTB89784.1 trehalose operon repressor [Streptococcus sp. zg-36]MWV55455.1 trehalose operon repressor [Streptococcus sp. zg-70]QTH47648.1 trehalose operon repressor [Streptococcus sp. zg-86]